MTDSPSIKRLEPLILTSWVTLVTRAVALNEGGPSQLYHSFRQRDYVSVLAETGMGEIVLVRQFRPALETFTLELPGGLREKGSDPADCAARELEEEAGFHCRSPLVFLGNLCPDSGRLENRLWCYFTNDVEPIPGWQPETGIDRVLMSKGKYLDAIRNGNFSMALHIAVTGLAVLNNKLPL